MFDFNLLNRASFQETVFDITVTVPKGATETKIHSLNNGAICLQRMEWKYSVPGGQLDDYGWPKVPMQVSVNDAFVGQTASPVVLSPPFIIKDSLEIKVFNPSALKVSIHLTITGILVLPIGGSIIPSNKEILGYSLLDNSQRGMLALREASMDRYDEYLAQLGVEDTVRKQMLLGQIIDPLSLSGKSLSEQQASLTARVLPQLEESKSANDMQSLLIGDLVQFKLENKSEISLEELKLLADYLLAKKWARR